MFNSKYWLRLGRQFDKDGNMKQWWNNSTITAFRTRAQCIIDQYSRYKVNELGLYMNGKLTQSENIADNGGLKQAFRVSFLDLSHQLNEFQLVIENYNLITNCIFVFFFFAGVQEMGGRSCGGWWLTGLRIKSWSVIFPELCSNLVWFNATGRCSFEASIIGSFAGRDSCAWAIIKFQRIFRCLQLPIRFTNESNTQMQRLVIPSSPDQTNNFKPSSIQRKKKTRQKICST